MAERARSGIPKAAQDPYRLILQYPDGCSIMYSGPFRDQPPSVDLEHLVDDHEHWRYDGVLRHALAKTFYQHLPGYPDAR